MNSVITFGAFRSISKLWGLSIDEQAQLLGISHKTLNEWIDGEFDSLPYDVFLRISHLLRIFRRLAALLPIEAADSWVKQENAYFDGQTALSLMMSGVDGMEKVKHYLDGQINY